jgi:predicted nucleic acid-binding protein
MNPVLVDSSIWIEYFKNPKAMIIIELERLIDTDNFFTNDLILAELIPFFKIRKNNELIESLSSIQNLPIEIDWKEIIEFQTMNLKKGINKVGIPDLTIAQNAIQNNALIFTLDKHFQLMEKHLNFNLYRF